MRPKGIPVPRELANMSRLRWTTNAAATRSMTIAYATHPTAMNHGAAARAVRMHSGDTATKNGGARTAWTSITFLSDVIAMPIPSWRRTVSSRRTQRPAKSRLF
jgi:hypothetical protein